MKNEKNEPTKQDLEAYELLTGNKLPDDPSPQDMARARIAGGIYRRDAKSLAAQKGAQTRRKRQTERKQYKASGVPIPKDMRTEKDEQLDVARWLDAVVGPTQWLHIPNEGKRSYRLGKSLRAQGLRRGAPDVLVFAQPPKYASARGVAIELKRRSGGRLTPEQKEWLLALEDNGWLTHVAQGADEAIEWLQRVGFGG